MTWWRCLTNSRKKKQKGWVSKLSSCPTCQVKWNNYMTIHLCANACVYDSDECWTHKCVLAQTCATVILYIIFSSACVYIMWISDGKYGRGIFKYLHCLHKKHFSTSLFWVCMSKSVCTCVRSGLTDQLEQGNQTRTCQEEAGRSLLFISSASVDLKNQKLIGCSAAQLLCLCNLTAGRWLTYCMRSVNSYSMTRWKSNLPSI